jgi:Xaa-Pro dipeptidase
MQQPQQQPSVKSMKASPPTPPPHFCLPAPAFDGQMHAHSRHRLVQALLASPPPAALPPRAADTYCFLQGGEATARFETDHEPLFRQESNFAYLFGCKEPGLFAW